MGDNDTPAGDAPELAGTATADTESVYAWALDEEGDTEELPRRLTPRRITALAVGASLARAAAVAVATLRPGADPAVAPPTQTRATLPSAGRFGNPGNTAGPTTDEDAVGESSVKERVELIGKCAQQAADLDRVLA